MKKLTNVNYARAERMLPEQRKELELSDDKGLVAIESWVKDGRLETKAVRVSSICDYIFSLG